MGLKGNLKKIDNPSEVSKRVAQRIADKTAEKVALNLKNKEIKY